MKIVTYAHHPEDLDRLGRLQGKDIIPLAMTPAEFYRQGLSAIPHLTPSDEPSIAQDTVIIRPIVPNAGKIICIGLNYHQHATESNMPVPSTPIIFSKFNNALAGHGEKIPLASSWQAVDYEAELAVIIGKPARRITEADALNYVLGYTCANDLSERHLQLQQAGGQWLLGKTLDKFLPLGPCLTTTDDVPNPQNLTIKGWLNNDLRQNSSTRDMIYSVAYIIAYISHHFTLSIGDVICTGTPEGVILGRAQKDYLRAGDTYRIEIEHIGTLTNSFSEETSS